MMCSSGGVNRIRNYKIRNTYLKHEDVVLFRENCFVQSKNSNIDFDFTKKKKERKKKTKKKKKNPRKGEKRKC